MSKKTVVLQENECNSCKCMCICNADCGGDVKRCTSSKALKQNCNHICKCYEEELVKEKQIISTYVRVWK